MKKTLELLLTTLIMPGIVLAAPIPESNNPKSEPTTIVQKQSKQDQIINYARSKIGTPYIWEGRLTNKFPGLDCLGLPYRAFSTAHNEKWYNTSKYTFTAFDNIESGALGDLVDLPSPNIDSTTTDALKKGDAVYFLVDFNMAVPGMEEENIPIDTIAGKPQWSYHLTIYSGNGNIIHASPWAGEVVEEPLSNFKDEFQILATRRK